MHQIDALLRGYQDNDAMTDTAPWKTEFAQV